MIVSINSISTCLPRNGTGVRWMVVTAIIQDSPPRTNLQNIQPIVQTRIRKHFHICSHSLLCKIQLVLIAKNKCNSS